MGVGVPHERVLVVVGAGAVRVDLHDALFWVLGVLLVWFEMGVLWCEVGGRHHEIDVPAYIHTPTLTLNHHMKAPPSPFLKETRHRTTRMSLSSCTWLAQKAILRATTSGLRPDTRASSDWAHSVFVGVFFGGGGTIYRIKGSNDRSIQFCVCVCGWE